jgi:hypothetical protein
MENKVKSFVDSLLKLHKTLGYKGIIKYALIGLGIYALINFRPVISGVIEVIDEISRTIHEPRINKRDELVFELSPMLSELRAITGADRILYIEYHNSKENLVGIPFKYLDLVLTHKKYGIPEFDIKNYHELNAGVLAPIYMNLRKDGYVINRGPQDYDFLQYSHEVSDFVHAQDGSVQQVYLNLPGVNTPIGLIILEWLTEDSNRDWDAISDISRDYVTRINGLVLSKSRF